MFHSKNFLEFKNIEHCFFSRQGGFSNGIYGSLNCGFGSRDKKENIKKNINLVSRKIGIKDKNLMLMNQTHGINAILINSENQKEKKFHSDAIITRVKGLALGVLTADCVPVILFDRLNNTIGCIHAGWKGAFLGIIENTLNIFKKINSRNEIYACIGPCIGKQNYEVDNFFFEKFLNQSKNNHYYFEQKNNDKKNFDLRQYVHDKLINSGVVLVDNVNYDTFDNNEKFYSYRRSKSLGENDYGRCISVICLK